MRLRLEDWTSQSSRLGRHPVLLSGAISAISAIISVVYIVKHPNLGQRGLATLEHGMALWQVLAGPARSMPDGAY